MTTLPPICRALAMGLNEEFEKMRTAKEAAREYAETLWNRESTLEWEVSRDACKSRSERDFLAGEEFGYRRGFADAWRWIPVSEQLPEEGRLVLVKEEYISPNSDETAKTNIKGHELAVWNGCEWQLEYIDKPTHWRLIEPVKK